MYFFRCTGSCIKFICPSSFLKFSIQRNHNTYTCFANILPNWCKNECFRKRTTCNWDNRIFVVGFFYDDRIYFLPHSSRFMTDFRIELFLEFPWNLGYIYKTFLSGTYFNRTFVVGFNSYDERIFILTTFVMI